MAIDRATIDAALDSGRVRVCVRGRWHVASRIDPTRMTSDSWFIVVRAGDSAHIITNQADHVEFKIV